jgi:hypothetical protein
MVITGLLIFVCEVLRILIKRVFLFFILGKEENG